MNSEVIITTTVALHNFVSICTLLIEEGPGWDCFYVRYEKYLAYQIGMINNIGGMEKWSL